MYGPENELYPDEDAPGESLWDAMRDAIIRGEGRGHVKRPFADEPDLCPEWDEDFEYMDLTEIFDIGSR